MKKFITRSLIFIILLSIPFILPLFIPEKFSFNAAGALYTYQTIEASGPFSPLYSMDKTETGDLNAGAEFAVQKKVHWQTDEFGYRNIPADTNCYDFVIIGDSNIAGYGLDQNQTLSSILERKSGLKVYSMAPANPEDFIKSEQFNNCPPKTVIISGIEKNAYGFQYHKLHPIQEKTSKDRINSRFPSLKRIQLIYDRIFRKLSLFRYVRMQLEKAMFTGSAFKSHESPAQKYPEYTQKDQVAQKPFQIGNAYVNYRTKMLFNKDIRIHQGKNEEAFENVSKTIEEYDTYFKSRGIMFIYLPIPDKENIYFEDIPKEANLTKPKFLPELISSLRSKGVMVIDTQSGFKKHYREEPLYLLDDTHLSPKGVEITADLIVNSMERKEN